MKKKKIYIEIQLALVVTSLKKRKTKKKKIVTFAYKIRKIVQSLEQFSFKEKQNKQK